MDIPLNADGDLSSLYIFNSRGGSNCLAHLKMHPKVKEFLLPETHIAPRTCGVGAQDCWRVAYLVGSSWDAMRRNFGLGDVGLPLGTWGVLQGILVGVLSLPPFVALVKQFNSSLCTPCPFSAAC